VRDGRIASVHNYHDRLAFLAQLGLTDATTAA
jgi:ketosteroid isomerase-like protein